MIVSLGPFLLGSKPCETSLLQDELSLTSVVVLEWVPPPMGVGIWLEREGGRGCRDCSLLVELRRAARGEAGGRGWRRTTETTLCVCSHILRNLRKLPENNNNEKSHLCYTAWKSPEMSHSIFAIRSQCWMRLFLWFSTNVSLLGFVSSIVTIIRKPVGHENECSSRKERSISFTVMASFFGTTATVCKWTVEAVLWLLLCFFFTVGPSDWIALLFYMTQREKQYDRCCWGCIMDYGQSKNNNWFHMHSSCSHAISYITSVDLNTPKI